MATPKSKRSALLKGQIAEGQKELLKITAEARKAIELKILKAAERGDFVRAASVRDGLYNGIADEYVKLNRGVNDWTKKRSKTVAKSWHTLAIDDLPKAAAGVTFGQFSEKYLTDIIGKVNPATASKKVAINARMGGMLAEDVAAIRAAVTDTLRQGALTGMTNPQLSAEMIKKVKGIKPMTQFIDKAGRKWTSDSYFGMLNRTLHATVARETYADTALEAGFDLMFIEGGPSAGPPDDPCNRWYGKVISMTGKTKGYPTYSDSLSDGMWHPNCAHSMSVYTP